MNGTGDALETKGAFETDGMASAGQSLTWPMTRPLRVARGPTLLLAGQARMVGVGGHPERQERGRQEAEHVEPQTAEEHETRIAG
jgi:hypothetical protein